MYKYLLTSTAFPGEMEYQFDATGNIRYYENRSDIDTDYMNALVKVFPVTEEGLMRMAQRSKTITLVKTAQVFSFKDFYDAYKNKVGNKGRAEKLWNALTATEHALIMAHLPLYDAYLAARPKMEKAYAETFLNQRRWENELPK